MIAVLLLAFAAPLAAEDLPAWTAGAKGDLAFQTSAFLRETAYRNPDRVATDGAPSGAYSPMNRRYDATGRGRWLIEEQRYAFDAIVAGISYGRQDLVDRGRTIFDWGFRQERADGSFDCPDRYHSASFFVEAAAHAALILRASRLGPANEEWIRSIEPKLAAAARWMADPKNEGPGRTHDRPYTHRFYLDADALGETGVLVGDPALVARSWTYVEEGLARQDPSGFNPEKGGWDTSYHSVGLLFALYYATLVADDARREKIAPMIRSGLAWLKARVGKDGVVDQTGNTRTGFGQERGPNGTLKTMSYGSAYRAAYDWAMMTRDPSWADAARLLAAGQAAEKKRAKASAAR